MYEKLKQMSYEKGKFLSLDIIVAQEIRHIIPILVHFQNLFVSTRLKGYLTLHCSFTSTHLHLSQTSLKVSQKATDAKSPRPKFVTNSYGVKMLGVKMGEKGTPKKTRVSKSNDNDDEPIMFINPKHL